MRRGFTLIELVVVIAVLAILAGVAVPKFIDVTREAKIAAVQADFAVIRSAQISFFAEQFATNSVGRYATSFAELGFPPSFATGSVTGYVFCLNPFPISDPQTEWNAGATPVEPLLGDNVSYYTGTLGDGAMPGPLCDLLGHSQGSNVGVLLASLHQQGLDLLRSLSLLAPGSALSRAQALFNNSAAARTILLEADLDGDGFISPQEVFRADVLRIARKVQKQLFPGVKPGRRIANDSVLTGIVGAYFASVQRTLMPAVASARVAIGDLTGDGMPDLLREVTPHPAVADLQALHNAIIALDTSPGSGDMTGATAKLNLQRLLTLLKQVDSLTDLLDYRQLSAAKQQLRLLRKRADLWPVKDNWLQGPAAAQFAALIDSTLHALDDR